MEDDTECEIEELRHAMRGMMVFQGELVRRMLEQNALKKEDVAHALSNSSDQFAAAGEFQALWDDVTAKMMR